MNLIQTMDYGVVTSRKLTKDSGLRAGDTVMVIGQKQLPEKRSDPYLTRTYVICIRVGGGKHQLPAEDNDYKSYLLDPRSLTKIEDEETLSKFSEELNNQYDK